MMEDTDMIVVSAITPIHTGNPEAYSDLAVISGTIPVARQSIYEFLMQTLHHLKFLHQVNWKMKSYYFYLM